ncbi:MAG: hypothetical protein WC761_01440 [Candidatus Paceibacterota bacterium]|jgi:hypothetical protein
MSDKNNDRETRNAVFGGPQQGVEGLTSQDYAKKELGVEIPIDAVPLPSKGKAYEPTHPLYNADNVEYRAMTAKEEDLLMSPALIKRGTVVTELIKSCLIDKNIDVATLLSGDRNALMIAIRSSGYGRLYEPTYSCPSCDFKNEMQVDLSALGIKPLEINPVSPGTNLFRFKLPKTGKTVGFRFLTGKEEEEIIAEVEMRKKRGILNTNIVTTRLSRCIVELDGQTDRGLINKFVSYMPAMDSLHLREYIDANEPGVDMTVEFKCTSCDHYEEVSMPMGPSFFWPNARR